MAERTALFVRVPSELAAELDARAQRLGRSKQDVVTELLSDAPVAPHDDDILDLDAVAVLLRVEPADVMERIADGDFPARRFGPTWRFSRAAISSWLSGTDPVADRRTGFSLTTATTGTTDSTDDV